MSNEQLSEMSSETRKTISNLLFGKHGTAKPATIADNPIDSDLSDSEDIAVQRSRSWSMSEKLGLTKVPTHDYEAILRGDYSS